MNSKKRDRKIKKTLGRLLELRDCEHCKFSFKYDADINVRPDKINCSYSPDKAAYDRDAEIQCDEYTHSAFEGA